MKIKSVRLENFGPYAEVTAELGDYNVLIGPNGSGKSHFLMSLAWAITGACARTTPDGKGAERLMRTGADGYMVAGMQLDPLGWIERKKNGRHTLLLDWQDGVGVQKNQALLYDALGIPPETATAIFDPSPLLGKTANDQRAALLRVLRPSKIEVPASCKEAGIRALAGGEHIDQIIKERKEVNIRDLNAEIRVATTRQPPEAPPKPRIEIAEINEKIALANKELNSRQDALNEWEADKITYERRLALPIDESAIQLSEAERLMLDGEITKLSADSSSNSDRFNELAARVSTMSHELKNVDLAIASNNGRASSLRESISRLESEPPFDCSADACPIRQAKQDDLRAKIAEMKANVDELQKQIDIYGKAKADLEDRIARCKVERDGIEKQIAADNKRVSDMKNKIAAHAKSIRDKERREGDTKDLAETLEKIAALRLERGQWQSTLTRLNDAAATYNDWKTKADARTQWAQNIARLQSNLADQQRIVDDLVSLKKKLVGDKSEAFLAEMQAFLEPFGIDRLVYTYENGFQCQGRAAELLSDGQRNMMFEAAFRVAVATITGIGIVVLDGIAPLGDQVQSDIEEGLRKSGHQIIEARTEESIPQNLRDDGLTLFWVDGNGKLIPEADIAA